MKLFTLFSLFVLACVASCQGNLSESLDGKQCDASGACLDGYECDPETNLCVPAGSVPPPVTCSENTTDCDGKCADLTQDRQHCGGCGATCTAPENADPTCVNGVCKFACSDGYAGCGQKKEPNKAALYAMGAFLTLPPSVPRFVVGDVGTALLLTGLRGGSFALGAFVDWDDDSEVVPVTLAFVAPLTLGIVDLATTPRRWKAAEPKQSDSAALKPRLDSIGPTATVGRGGALMPALGASGVF